MEFDHITKREPGHFINRYDLTYRTADGKEKVYEIISRKKNLTDFSELCGGPADAVVIIMTNADDSKILVNREFRMAVGEPVYNFPAGLIDPGETVDEAAARELWEETGLHLDEITDRLGESYSAVGFANEKNVCVIGHASGEFAPSTSAVEEIEAHWFTKAEVRELLRTSRMAARTQAYLYLWSRE